MDKLTSIILPDDPRKMASDFVDQKVIPTTLDWLYGLAQSALDSIFNRTTPSSHKHDITSYSTSSKSYAPVRSLSKSREYEREMAPDLTNIEFYSEEDAYHVLDLLRERIDRYRIATVGYYLECCDQKTTPEAFNFGWRHLGNIPVKWYRTPGGSKKWYVTLPTPMHIDNRY